MFVYMAKSGCYLKNVSALGAQKIKASDTWNLTSYIRYNFTQTHKTNGRWSLLSSCMLSDTKPTSLDLGPYIYFVFEPFLLHVVREDAKIHSLKWPKTIRSSVKSTVSQHYKVKKYIYTKKIHIERIRSKASTPFGSFGYFFCCFIRFSKIMLFLSHI